MDLYVEEPAEYRPHEFFSSFARSSRDENSTLPDHCLSSLESFPAWLDEDPIYVPNIFIGLLLSLYIFWMLAYICDEYTVPSVEKLCTKLRLPYDVGAATLLAASTSGPELFINVIGTFITETDLGISTIVGSAVFNCLVISSLCGFMCKTPMQLDWWCVTRETFWYMVAVILMTVFIIDEYINVYESAALLLVYILNVVILCLDGRIRKCVFRLRKKPDEEAEEEVNESESKPEESHEPKTFMEHICGYPKEKHVIYRILYILAYPYIFILAITIPPVKYFFIGALIVSIIWIGGLCYLVSWFLTVVGYNLYISDAVMGLTILAAGTSVPEVVTSYVVLKQGYGEMAISNAIGSNTFDILVCLGLPWFILNLKDSRDVPIITDGMLYVTISLVSATLLLYLSFVITKFRLNIYIGIFSLLMYIIFLVASLCLFIINCENKK